MENFEDYDIMDVEPKGHSKKYQSKHHSGDVVMNRIIPTTTRKEEIARLRHARNKQVLNEARRVMGEENNITLIAEDQRSKRIKRSFVSEDGEPTC